MLRVDKVKNAKSLNPIALTFQYIFWLVDYIVWLSEKGKFYE